jgi:hypothetical protein
METLEQQPGFLGAVFQTQKVVSDVEGLFGASFTKDVNAVLRVRNEVGTVVRGVTIGISWAGGSSQILDYDPAILYDDKYPEDTPLTITVSNAGSSTNYQPLSLAVTIPAGGFRVIDLLLLFAEKYARITKKRFL